MPPRKTRAAHGSANSASRAWDRSLSRLKDVSIKSLDDELSLADVTMALDDVSLLIDGEADGIDGTVWVAVGPDGVAPLAGLYALAQRRSSPSLSPDIPDSLRSTHAALRTKLRSSMWNLVHDDRWSPAYLHALAQTILRTHSLRAYSALLSDAAAALVQRRSRRSVQAALDVLRDTRMLLHTLRSIVYVHDAAEGISGAGKRIQSELRRELSGELVDSGLLESWSRLMLALGSCEDAADAAAMELWCMAVTLSNTQDNIIGDLHQAAALDSNPSFAYLLTSHLVGLAAALDGGPTYGMPDAAGLAGEGAGAASGAGVMVPLFNCNGGRLRGASSPEGAGANLAHWALQVLCAYASGAQRPLTEELQCIASDPVSQQMAGLDLTVLAAEMTDRSPALCSWSPLYREASLQEGKYSAVARTIEAQGVADGSAASSDDVRDATQSSVRQLMEQLRALRRQRLGVLPLHSLGMFDVCMRLAAAAVEAMRVAAPMPGLMGAEAQGATAGLSPTGAQQLSSRTTGQRPRVEASESGELAWASLLGARGAAGRVASCGAVAAWTQRRLEAYWRLALEVAVRAGLSQGGDGWGKEGSGGCSVDNWSSLPRLITPELPSTCTSGLPREPPPDIAAALTAGYIPTAERLLRRSYDRVRIFKPTVTPSDESAASWCHLLAFDSSPSRVAALLATVAKRLRRHARGQDFTFKPSGEHQLKLIEVWDLGTAWLPQLLEALPQLAAQELEEAAATRDGNYWGGTGAGGGTVTGGAVAALAETAAAASSLAAGDTAAARCCTPGRQLGMLLTYTASQVLPALWEFIREQICVPMAHTEKHDEQFIAPLLGWVPALAAAQVRAERAAVAASAAGGAGAGPSSRAWAAAQEWRTLLWEQLDFGAMLGWVLGMVEERLALPKKSDTWSPHNTSQLAPSLIAAVRALLHLAPAELAAAIARGDAGAAESGQDAGSSTGSNMKSRGRNSSAAASAAAATVAAAAPAPRLNTSLLRRVLGPQGPVAQLELLAALEAACSRGAAAGPSTPAPLPADLEALVSGAVLLAPPSESRLLLRTCANPRCCNLEGPSEAALKLRRCGGCGERVRYCGHTCQAEHWAAGHSKECRRGLGPAAAGVVPD